MATATRWTMRQEPYDPDARDADNDGIVQEQTPWERPAGTNLVDDLGRAITRGSNATQRPRGMRVVDRQGNPVDYTPTYERPGGGFGAGGGTPLAEAGAASLRERGLPTIRDITAGPTPLKSDGKPEKRGTPLSDHGTETLKEQGLPNTRETNTPPVLEVRDVPEAKPAKTKKPKETPGTDDFALSPGVTLASVNRPDLEKPEKPRSPFKPSPPPLEGRAQELADQAGGDFKKFMELLDKEGYVVFDYETTGLQDGNIPVQIGAVRIKDGKIVERFNVFTNPQRPLSDWSKENLKDKDGNPLTDEWLGGQMDLAEAHKQLAEFMGDSIIVAHNLPYDGEIIDRMMKDAGIDHKPSGSIDTLMLLRSAVPKGDGESGPERHTLGALADFFEVDLGDAAHTADADSEAAALVLQKAMNWAGDNDSSPDIFDATKQKELFDEATKKYNLDRKKYEDDLKKYQSDLANYERAITRADEPVAVSADPSLAVKADLKPEKPTEEVEENAINAGTKITDNILEARKEADQSWRDIQVVTKDGRTIDIRRDASPDDGMPIIDVMGAEAPDIKMQNAREVGLLLSEKLSQEEMEQLFPDGVVVTITPDGIVRVLSANRDSVDPAYLDALRNGRMTIVDPSTKNYKELLAEGVASHFIENWATMQGDEELYRSASRVFGAVDPIVQDVKEDEARQKIVDAMVLASYENTQRRFREQGITEVVLHRGMRLQRGSSPLGDYIFSKAETGEYEEDVQVSLRPLSAFSYNLNTAQYSFGEYGSSGGSVMTSRVPVERIFSTAVTGFGCREEDEMMVIGGGNILANLRWTIQYRPKM